MFVGWIFDKVARFNSLLSRRVHLFFPRTIFAPEETAVKLQVSEIECNRIDSVAISFMIWSVLFGACTDNASLRRPVPSVQVDIVF